MLDNERKAIPERTLTLEEALHTAPMHRSIKYTHTLKPQSNAAVHVNGVLPGENSSSGLECKICHKRS